MKRRERERLAWLSKLTQQASQFAYKRDTTTTRSHFFFILLSQIERKTVLRVGEKRKEKVQEKERERGVDLLKEMKKKKLTSSSYFSKPKRKVT